MDYPDTSFLYALYRSQNNSDQALQYRVQHPEPLCVTRLLLWEFRQSARFQAYRYQQDRSVGFPLQQANQMLDAVRDDLNAGVLLVLECDLERVLAVGERISNQRTSSKGHRGFDILHVATALELNAEAFLSFDANQNELAKSEGLRVPLGKC